jgi:hypothetical protein
VPEPQAIALGLALYFLNLIASLAGAPAFAFGGKKQLRLTPETDTGAGTEAVSAA